MQTGGGGGGKGGGLSVVGQSLPGAPSHRHLFTVSLIVRTSSASNSQTQKPRQYEDTKKAQNFHKNIIITVATREELEDEMSEVWGQRSYKQKQQQQPEAQVF